MLRQSLVRLPVRARVACAPRYIPATGPSARGIATDEVNEVDEWIEVLTTRPPQIDTDDITTYRANQLISTLPSRQSMAAKGFDTTQDGKFLAKGHNLVFWQPAQFLDNLAPDGTSAEYNAPPPYTRRMWAGGSWEWRKGAGLTLGGKATQVTTVPKVETKGGKIFVYQNRDLYDGAKEGGENDWAIRETRTHVFFPELKDKQGMKKLRQATADDSNKPNKKEGVDAMPKPDYTHTYTPSSPLLFRYSALTWNAHKIHYDRDWTREVENQPDLVVHGPLTAQLLVDVANNSAVDAAVLLKKFEYRATHPMYVNRPVSINAAWEGPRGAKLLLWAVQDGRIGMKGTATMESP